MNVYFISGIGADKRLFTYIQLPPGYNAKFITWVPPLPSESIADYATRLFEPFKSTSPFVLIGLSLGGIVAIEIAKQYKPACTIIISSVPTTRQLPPYYNFARKLRLSTFFSATFFKITATVKHFLLLRSWANKRLLRRVIWDGDPKFINWGMKAVLKWNNSVIAQPFYHIHGTLDEVFPIRFTTPTHIIQKAGHMLVITHPQTVNSYLSQILSSLQHALAPVTASSSV